MTAVMWLKSRRLLVHVVTAGPLSKKSSKNDVPIDRRSNNLAVTGVFTVSVGFEPTSFWLWRRGSGCEALTAPGFKLFLASLISHSGDIICPTAQAEECPLPYGHGRIVVTWSDALKMLAFTGIYTSSRLHTDTTHTPVTVCCWGGRWGVSGLGGCCSVCDLFKSGRFHSDRGYKHLTHLHNPHTHTRGTQSCIRSAEEARAAVTDHANTHTHTLCRSLSHVHTLSPWGWACSCMYCRHESCMCVWTPDVQSKGQKSSRHLGTAEEKKHQL